MNLGVNPMPLTSSTAFWKSSDGVSDQFPAGLRVLVVDGDPTCLRILEKMLRKCLYEVTKCSRAEVALKLLRDHRDGFDIVISEVHMPDMDGFRLLVHVGLEMDLPVIMMSADDSKNAVMKGVTHGACDYLIKPVRMEALRNIWQHVVRNKKSEGKEMDLEQSGSVEDGERLQKPSEDETEEMDYTHTFKKPPFVWSVELHQLFINAVNQLGIDKAVPRKILELMNVPGLTRENVASHLQKYRLYLRMLSRQQQNGPGNSFKGPQDAPYGAMTSFNGIDLRAHAYSSELQKPFEDVDYSSSANEGNWKSSEDSKDDEDEVEERDDTSMLKKPRVVWSVELHQQFVNAVNELGIEEAVPEKILELMNVQSLKKGFHLQIRGPSQHCLNVQSLTRENVESHLQEYLLYLRRLSRHHQNGLGLSQAIPGAVSGRYGIDNTRPPTYAASLPQSSFAVDFSRMQSTELPQNTFPLMHNSGISTFNSKGMLQEDLNSEMKAAAPQRSNVRVLLAHVRLSSELILLLVFVVVLFFTLYNDK